MTTGPLIKPPAGEETNPARAGEYNEYFNTRVPSGAAVPLLRFWHRRMLRLAARLIPELPRLTVLEVGTGWGLFGDECASAGIAYQGLEMNAAQAASLRARGLEVVAGTIPPFPHGKPVQAIWMSHVLEHASSYREAREMLAAAHQRLDPGGYIVVIGPDILSSRGEFWNSDWSHGFPTSLRRLRELLLETGYQHVEVRHHVASIAQPFLCWLITNLFRLIPYRLLDVLLERITGRSLAYSFMTVFGWRQVFGIGRKP
jgi:hypothetical protein